MENYLLFITELRISEYIEPEICNYTAITWRCYDYNVIIIYIRLLPKTTAVLIKRKYKTFEPHAGQNIGASQRHHYDLPA